MVYHVVSKILYLQYFQKISVTCCIMLEKLLGVKIGVKQLP